MTPIADLVQQSAAISWLFIPSAIVLGALHGLEPGHSKTMMAAFIVAIRGTVPQAALLAVTATISHTAVVWLVAILALTYGSHWSAETTEPYFELASAAIIIGIAVWMLLRTYRDQRAADAAAAHTHEETKLIHTGHGLLELSILEEGAAPRWRVRFKDGGSQPDAIVTLETVRDDGSRQTFTFAPHADYLESVSTIPEPHQFSVVLTLTHGGRAHTYEMPFVEHGHDHEHRALAPSAAGLEDAHQRAHALEIRNRFANRNVTTGQIALFGLTGGLLPCPAAVTVLLLCLQIQQFWLGIILVLCFSIGLALTLLTSGVAAAWGMRHASRRWPGFDTLARRLPYLSSAVIIGIGLYVGAQGWIALSPAP
jgi:nickel/cobalt transporter (NicO) family protein